MLLEMLKRAALADPGAQLDPVVRENPEPPRLGVEDRWCVLRRPEQPECAVGAGTITSGAVLSAAT